MSTPSRRPAKGGGPSVDSRILAFSNTSSTARDPPVVRIAERETLGAFVRALAAKQFNRSRVHGQGCGDTAFYNSNRPDLVKTRSVGDPGRDGVDGLGGFSRGNVRAAVALAAQLNATSTHDTTRSA